MFGQEPSQQSSGSGGGAYFRLPEALGGRPAPPPQPANPFAAIWASCCGQLEEDEESAPFAKKEEPLLAPLQDLLGGGKKDDKTTGGSPPGDPRTPPNSMAGPGPSQGRMPSLGNSSASRTAASPVARVGSSKPAKPAKPVTTLDAWGSFDDSDDEAGGGDKLIKSVDAMVDDILGGPDAASPIPLRSGHTAPGFVSASAADPTARASSTSQRRAASSRSQHRASSVDNDDPAAVGALSGDVPLLDKHHRLWKPDSSRKSCTLCDRAFKPPAVRRHHCRVCGDIYCNTCSEKRTHPAAKALVRVCKTCSARVTAETGMQWQATKEVSSCTMCSKSFTPVRRKHHCRQCGRVVCNVCSLKTDAGDAVMAPHMSDGSASDEGPSNDGKVRKCRSCAAGDQPIVWMRDDAVSNCLRCRKPFTTLRRKHHCRKCGKIYCESCTKKRTDPSSPGKKIRVCLDDF